MIKATGQKNRFQFNKVLHNFGIKIEEELKPYLDEHFETTFEKRSDDIFDVIDFTDNKNIQVEVKGRTCSSDAWEETIVTMGKIVEIEMLYEEKPELEVYIFFVFTDKTMYIKMPRERPNWKVKFTGSFGVKHLLIPVKELTEFEGVEIKSNRIS
jgi:hypothetical protein